MPKGPWGDRKKAMPLATRLLLGLGPMAISMVMAVCWVMALQNGYAFANGATLVIANALIIAASLWAVYFLRRTSPNA
jgi:hypothetical protein